MRIRQTLLSSLGGLLLLAPAASLHAAPGDTFQASGDVDVAVVESLLIQPIEDLRFGSFFQPAAATTVTIAPDGTISNTVEVSDISGPRGPAQFTVRGDASRLFLVFLPTNTTLSSGSAAMTIDQFRANALFNRIGRFDVNGEYDLRIGGRLNVGALQETGDYSGTFEFTVLYL